MKVAAVLERMIASSEGNLHDIKHLVKVWDYLPGLWVSLRTLPRKPRKRLSLQPLSMTILRLPGCTGKSSAHFMALPPVSSFLHDTWIPKRHFPHAFGMAAFVCRQAEPE